MPTEPGSSRDQQETRVLKSFLDLYEFPITPQRDLPYARTLVDFLKWPLRESVNLGGCATVALQFADAAKAQGALVTAELGVALAILVSKVEEYQHKVSPAKRPRSTTFA